LLRLVLQHPALAARLPISLISDDTDEGRALIAIIDLAESGESVISLGALSERFRGTPHGETLDRIAIGLIDTEFDPSVIELQFEDTLLKLQTDMIAKEIAALQEQERAGALSPSERYRLADLLKEKNALSGFTRPPVL
jgi:DNA primase